MPPLCTVEINSIRIDGYQRGELLGSLIVLNTLTQKTIRQINLPAIPMRLRPVENDNTLVQYNTGLDTIWHNVNFITGNVID